MLVLHNSKHIMDSSYTLTNPNYRYHYRSDITGTKNTNTLLPPHKEELDQ